MKEIGKGIATAGIWLSLPLLGYTIGPAALLGLPFAMFALVFVWAD